MHGTVLAVSVLPVHLSYDFRLNLFYVAYVVFCFLSCFFFMFFLV